MTKSIRRLFAELKPSHYQLQIVPDAVTMTFSGTVTIRLKKTGRPSKRLTFHQHGLKIASATVAKLDKKGRLTLEVVRINNQNSLREVRLHTAEMVYSGDYEVSMRFEGKITNGMTGIYPCFFTHDGQEHTLLATQFESHHAREAFPCIDEPEAKATFRLTLVAPEGQQVLSNTPIEHQEVAGSWDLGSGKSSSKTPATSYQLLATTFETTPRMSTYLLAFVIGELHSKSTKTARGTDVTAWATIAQPLDSLDFGLDVAKRSIEFFEEYFGVDYPLLKSDNVALPDFSSAAMENWGLITYRERVLLAYPDDASQATLEQIGAVITHETAHQWFGNLVTMRWWDELWLNESFANLMEYQALDALYPAWQQWDEFIVHEGLQAIRRDATPGVQAVQTNVRHPDEISSIIDPSIVYAKGGRVLYMLKTLVGDAAFRSGLANYFKRFAYQNTTGGDLWRALGEASHFDAANFMDPWLTQSGFPVISVDQKGPKVVLRQAHFLENGEMSDKRLWPVPLFASTPELPQLLTKAEAQYSLSSGEFVYLNQRAAGHYLVHYVNAEHRQYLIDLIRRGVLSAPDRLMLLNGAGMLSKAGHEPYGEVLRLIDAYASESSEAVWNVIALTIAELRRFIDWDERLEVNIKAFVRKLIKPEYERLGWDRKPQEVSTDTKLRAIILGLGAYADEPSIVDESLRRFGDYQQKAKDLDAETRSVIFTTAVKQGVQGAFEFLLAEHDATNNGELKLDIAIATTATKKPGEAEQILARLKDASYIKPQDLYYWLVYLMRNRHMREVAWNWMVTEWGWIEQTFARDKSYDYFPRYAASICNTHEWSEKFRSFFEPKRQEIVLERNINMGFAEIDIRVKWLERDLKSVQDFLKS